MKNQAVTPLEQSSNDENLRSEVERLREEVKTLHYKNEHLSSTLTSIKESKSWRLTECLRTTTNQIRKLFPLIRFRKVRFKLESGDNTLVSGVECKVLGQGSTIKLVPQTKNAVPDGWIRINGNFQSSRGQMFFLLHWRTSKGFSPSQRAWVSFSNGVQEPILINVPKKVLEYRLDPFDTDAEFSLDKLSIQSLGKLQVPFLLLWKKLKPVITHPGALKLKVIKGLGLLRSGGVKALWQKLKSEEATHNYQDWINRYDTLTDSDREAIKRHISTLEYKPLISVIMPTWNTPHGVLKLAIESVQKQLYSNWELCIADDASKDTEVRKIIEEYSKNDSRIKFIFRENSGHISEASNSAINIASGEFLSFLDHDDELTEHALYFITVALNENGDLDIIYSDEDKKDLNGVRFKPYFKSDWNPDLLLQQNYVCHLLTLRASIVKEIGGFNSEYNGAQDWDLLLRVADKSDESKIKHIPRVLYHWRVMPGSTAQSTGYKPYVLEAQKKAVADHLNRIGEKNSSVIIRKDIDQLRVTFSLPTTPPNVSLIIPTKDLHKVLKRGIDSILEKTTYPNFEILVIDNGSKENDTFEYFKSLESESKVKVVRDEGPFNFSRINNRGVAKVNGSVIGFLNNDLEVITPSWLDEMVSYALRPKVGVVGARLLFPDGLLQHGGVILGIGGIAGHSCKGRPRYDVGYWNKAILVQDMSAVTAACMVLRREVFEEVGGFEEEGLGVAFNDVDLCLKIRKKGYRVVYNPYAELYHHESASRGYEDTPEKFRRFESEINTMKERWKDLLMNDPYYNPNLTLLTEDYAFAFPPRVMQPWKKY